MSTITWLMTANVAVWIGIAAYVAFLAKEQNTLKKRLAMKESMETIEHV